MRTALRAAIGLVVFLEAIAFFAGVLLHLGVTLPIPYVESSSMVSAALETGSGALLLLTLAAILVHHPRASEIAVAAHVSGVVGVAYGIATRRSSLAMQASHHPPMLIVLIVLLVVLATPPVQQALRNGRRRSRGRSRRRRKSMYSL